MILHVYPNLCAVLDESAKKFPNRVGYTNLGADATYAQMKGYAESFAAYLQSLPDMKPGDRVALMMPNLLQYPVALFGILRAGMIVVNVNPLYTPRELEHQLNDSGAAAIVIVSNFAHTLAKSGGETTGPACDPDAHGRPAFHRQRYAGELCGQVH